MDGARERLLAAADRCFERHGIAATGVNQLLAEANVARMSLYHHFGSKDRLVVAYLRRRHDAWANELRHHLADIDDPHDRLVAVLRDYAWRADQSGFRGCVFINAAAELPVDHDAWAVIHDHKQWVRALLEDLAAAAEVPGASELAHDLFLVAEGAIATAGIERSGVPLATADRTARRLIALHAGTPTAP